MSQYVTIYHKRRQECYDLWSISVLNVLSRPIPIWRLLVTLAEARLRSCCQHPAAARQDPVSPATIEFNGSTKGTRNITALLWTNCFDHIWSKSRLIWFACPLFPHLKTSDWSATLYQQISPVCLHGVWESSSMLVMNEKSVLLSASSGWRIT